MDPHQPRPPFARGVALVQVMPDCSWSLVQAMPPYEFLAHVQALLKATVANVKALFSKRTREWRT